MHESNRPAETFSDDWLGLREPVDHQSRAGALTVAAAGWLGRWPALRLLDLGCGSGSNMRYLAPRLPGPQQWRLVDHDPELLARARTRCSSLRDARDNSLVLTVQRADLAELDGLLAAVEPVDLVTASALLDLVSERWIDRLARFCKTWKAAVLITLSYDGQVAFDRPLEDDDLIRECVNAHQRRDKGFGAALGPDGATVLEQALKARGFQVESRPSPWLLDHRHSALQVALINGWCDAALEQAPDHRERIEAWRRHRVGEARAGRSRVSVGHRDIFAVPGHL